MSLLVSNSASLDTEFLQYLQALIAVESAWNPAAVSSAGAVGLGQLLDIAVREVQQSSTELPDTCKVEAKYDVLDPSTNIRLCSCYLLLMKQRYNSWVLALIAYNGGGRQVQRFLSGKGLVRETNNYVVKVLHEKEKL